MVQFVLKRGILGKFGHVYSNGMSMKRSSPRYVSASSPVVSFSKILLPILGCIVLLFSIILPFCSVDTGRYMYIQTASNINRADLFNESFYSQYWSFRSLYTIFPHPSRNPGILVLVYPVDYWLSDCWFHDTLIMSLGLSTLFVVMFTAQILALAFGVASIFIRRIAPALVPVILCLTVIQMMIYVSRQLLNPDFVTFSFQPGYWLIFPSLVLFVAAFTLKLLTKKADRASIQQN